MCLGVAGALGRGVRGLAVLLQQLHLAVRHNGPSTLELRPWEVHPLAHCRRQFEESCLFSSLA